MSGPVSLLWRIRSDNSYFNICFDSPCRRLISSRTNTDAVIGVEEGGDGELFTDSPRLITFMSWAYLQVAQLCNASAGQSLGMFALLGPL